MCQLLTNCTGTQYQTAAPTQSSDRGCASLLTCTTTQFQTVPPTPTTNRECGSLRVCTVDEFENQAPVQQGGMFVSQRSCQTLSPCPAGMEQTVANTATRDRTCVTCAAGSVDHDSNRLTACASCLPGTNLSAAGLFGACDTHQCPAGTTDHDQATSSDCVSCPAGHYCREGEARAVAQTACASGTTDMDRKPSTPCVLCNPGTYTGAGVSGPCPLCVAPNVDDDANPSTACARCTAGTHVSQDGMSAPCATLVCPGDTFDHDGDVSTFDRQTDREREGEREIRRRKPKKEKHFNTLPWICILIIARDSLPACAAVCCWVVHDGQSHSHV